jgi:hypothetical protein
MSLKARLHCILCDSDITRFHPFNTSQMSTCSSGEYSDSESRFGGIPADGAFYDDASVADESVDVRESEEDDASELPIVDLTTLREQVQQYLHPILTGNAHQLVLHIECGVLFQITRETRKSGTPFVRVLLQLNNIKLHKAAKRDLGTAAKALLAHKSHTKMGVSHLSGLAIESQTPDRKQLVLHESEEETHEQQDAAIIKALTTLLKHDKGTVLFKKSDVISEDALEKAVDAAFHMIFFHMLKHRTAHLQFLVDGQHKSAYAVAVSHRDLSLIEQGDVLAPMFGDADLSLFFPVIAESIKAVLIMLKEHHPAMLSALKKAWEMGKYGNALMAFKEYQEKVFDKVFPLCST